MYSPDPLATIIAMRAPRLLMGKASILQAAMRRPRDSRQRTPFGWRLIVTASD
jgi:hypothetical protein